MIQSFGIQGRQNGVGGEGGKARGTIVPNTGVKSDQKKSRKKFVTQKCIEIDQLAKQATFAKELWFLIDLIKSFCS